jgi:hypothetical protein
MIEERSPSATDRLACLVEAQMPVQVDTDGSQDDWNVVGPAILAAATKHLRAIEHLQTEFPSQVVAWELVRSLFEYVATFAWLAADTETRTKRWLKYDFQQRLKLDNDLIANGGQGILDDAVRQELGAYEPELGQMPNLLDRAREADEAWSDTIEELVERLDANIDDDWQNFRAQYIWIYRNGSRFTHPSSHVVQAFVQADPPQLDVGTERPPERDLPTVATLTLSYAIAVASVVLPELGISVDEIVAALN